MGKKFPSKWTDIYENQNESKVMIALSRHKDKWRSISSISTSAGLSYEETEKILEKYLNKGMVFQKEYNRDYYCYWENDLSLIPEEKMSINLQDKLKRIQNFLKKKS